MKTGKAHKAHAVAKPSTDSSGPDPDDSPSDRDPSPDSGAGNDQTDSGSSQPSDADGQGPGRRPRSRDRSPQKPRMAQFSGKGDWDAFIFQFERIANRRLWSQHRRAEQLTDCLTDQALRYVQKLGEPKTRGYRRLRRELERRFQLDITAGDSRKELHTVKQNEDEALEEYSQRVHFLVLEGYPGAADATIQAVAVEAFLRGCKNKRAAEVAYEKDPPTIYKAQKFVKASVHNHQALYGGKPPISHRQVSFSGNETDDLGVRTAAVVSSRDATDPRTLQDLYDKLAPLVALPDRLATLEAQLLKAVGQGNRYRSPSPGGNRSPSPRSMSPERLAQITCYNCSEKGHFSRNCPKPKKGPHNLN